MAKKSNKVAAASPVTADVKSAKKGGKRGANEAIEKVVSAKKQKLENDEAVKAKQKSEKKQPKKVESSSESEESSELENNDVKEEPKATEKQSAAVTKNSTKKDDSSDQDESGSGSESGSDEEVKDAAPPAKPVKNGTLPSSKEKEESDDLSDDDGDDDISDEENADGTEQAKEKSGSEDEGSDDESSDNDPSKATDAEKASEKNSSLGESSGEESGGGDDDDDDEDDSAKTPEKKDTDVEMADASENQNKKSAPKTPKTPNSEATGSKTLFVGNLPFNVEEDNVREFFKSAGEVVDVRFATNRDGQFKGFGHVEFATPEDALKALESLNGQQILNRPVRLDLAKERGAYTPDTRENKSHQKGGGTAFVKGFDKSLGEDEIRSALQEHFGSCGNITRLSIPPDHESGGVRGMAYIDFEDSTALNKALELDGSEVNGWQLVVNEAKPRGGDSGGRGGRGGGRFGGRGGGGGGRFGGRGGDRFGGRGGGGGRFGGRGGRGGGGRGRGPNKHASGKN